MIYKVKLLKDDSYGVFSSHRDDESEPDMVFQDH